LREYNCDLIRNVAVVGHGHVGKTSLLESLLFKAEIITRQGSTTQGNTTSDHDPEEIRRQISIHSTIIPIEWSDHKLNMIDVPGYADFIGEAISTLRVVDSALIVFDAIDGYGVGSERLWKEADKNNLPKIVFINKMDKERANFDEVVEKIRAKFGKNLVPVHAPDGQGKDFRGIIHLLKEKAADPKYNEMLIEAAADQDEKILEEFMEGKEIPEQEISAAVKKGISQGKIIPIMIGSAVTGVGIPELFSAIVKWLPRPEGQVAEPLSAYVFKSVAEPHVGELSYVRVYSGSLEHSSTVKNASKGHSERVGQVVISRGKHKAEVQRVQAGDIATLPKLKNTRTGDTLCHEKSNTVLPHVEFPEANVHLAVRPKSKADQEKMGLGFSTFMKEDPTFKMRYDKETKEVVISGMGDVQLEIILGKLRKRHNLEIETSSPQVPYKETIRGKAKAQGKYKKQTGGHGQYGDTMIKIEPLERGKGFEFVNNISGGAIPKNYIPSVEKGVKEAMLGGVVSGYPVVDLKVILYDGSYHDVDSSDLAFKIAASMGFKKAFVDAKPVLIEPIVDIEVHIPSEFVGNVVSDLNKRRGRIVSIEEEKVIAQVPQAEIARYATDLRSFTHGAGMFAAKYSHYEEVLPQTQEKLCLKYQKEREMGSSSAR